MSIIGTVCYHAELRVDLHDDGLRVFRVPGELVEAEPFDAYDDDGAQLSKAERDQISKLVEQRGWPEILTESHYG